MDVGPPFTLAQRVPMIGGGQASGQHDQGVDAARRVTEPIDKPDAVGLALQARLERHDPLVGAGIVTLSIAMGADGAVRSLRQHIDQGPAEAAAGAQDQDTRPGLGGGQPSGPNEGARRCAHGRSPVIGSRP